jgi:hypothetical protein
MKKAFYLNVGCVEKIKLKIEIEWKMIMKNLL